MNKRYFKRGEKAPMMLQLFAEGGDGDGAGTGEGNGSGSGDDTGAVNTPSFDDLLKGDGYQAEFDRRVQKAVNTAITKAQEKWQALTDDKLSEAEKLARMTKDEKSQYMQQKQEKVLTEREAAITRRELMAEAKNTLAEKGLPVVLAEVLSYTDADACSKSVAAVEKAFQVAVQAAVEEKLKGGEPMKKAPQDAQITKEQFGKMGYTERLKMKTEQPELYKQLNG